MKQEIKFNRPGPSEKALKNFHLLVAREKSKVAPIILENRKEKGA